MATLPLDLRSSLRGLLKSPGTTLAAVAALGLGIGLTTAVYSMIYALVLEPLPFEEGQRLLHLEVANLSAGISSAEVTQHDFVDWRRQQTAFEDLSAFNLQGLNLSDEQRPERFSGALITPNFLHLLRQKTLQGRPFEAADAEPGAPPVALISESLWRTRYGADPKILGKAVRVDGTPTTLVGILPAGFSFPLNQEIWLPLTLDLSDLQRGEGFTLEVFGRLKDGVSLAQARAEFAALTAQQATQYPKTNEGISAVVKPYKEEFVSVQTRQLLWTMFGAVFLVLLVACANVANLLLARASRRGKELAIRTALGASRRRAMLHLLTDSLWIAALGGLLSLGVAGLSLRWLDGVLARIAPPFWFALKLDLHALFVVAAFALASGFLAGLFPALQATRGNLTEFLADSSRGSSSLRLGRLSRGLVVAEIAVCCGLLVGAALTLRTVINLSHLDFTFEPEQLITARISLSPENYAEPAQYQDFYRRLETALEDRPEVASVALTTSLPTNFAFSTRMEIEGRSYTDERDFPRAKFFTVTPAFFQAFGIAAQQGRVLAPGDREEALQVAVVTESFARRHFPEGPALGQRVRLQIGDEPEWRTLVGVVPDQYLDRLQTQDLAAAFLPLAQDARRTLFAVVSGPGSRDALVGALRDEVFRLDAQEPIFLTYTMAEVVELNTFQYRVLGIMFSAFAVSALLLAMIGLYGVMAFAVGQRTQEIGVRMAFGARRGQVLALILRQGLTQTALGLVIGLGLATLLGRLLQVALYDVQPTDPLAFAVPTLALAAVAAAACAIPARRAASLDPVKALHHS